MEARSLESPVTGMLRSSCSYLRRFTLRLPGERGEKEKGEWDRERRREGKDREGVV